MRFLAGTPNTGQVYRFLASSSPQSGAQEGAVGALGGGEFKESLARKVLNTKPVGGLWGGGQWAGSKIGTNRAQKVDRMVQLRESRCLQRKDSPPIPPPPLKKKRKNSRGGILE